MKVAITGHTKGIGKALFEYFAATGHQVSGYSRSNGFDIRDEKSRQAIAFNCKDTDIFINNAFDHSGQYWMLDKMIKQWSNSQKLIINISSKGGLLPDGMRDEYCEAKYKQNELIRKNLFKGNPRLLNIIVGLVDTDFSKHWNYEKIAAPDFASTVYQLATSMPTVQEVVLDVPGFDWSVYAPIT